MPGGGASGTSGAHSSTVPTASVPGTKGSGGRRWYFPATTSWVAKLTPAAATRRRTAPGRIGGGGISFGSSASNSRQDSQTSALMPTPPPMPASRTGRPGRPSDPERGRPAAAAPPVFPRPPIRAG